MKKIYSHFVNKLLYTLGLLLGFSSFAAAQYGAPVAVFKINGDIISKECQEPIPNIKVSVLDKDKNVIITSFSDSTGKFELIFDNSYYLYNQGNLLFEDVDGKLNHAFKKTEVKFDKNKDFVRDEKQTGWGVHFKSAPYRVEMSFKNGIPCAENMQIALRHIEPANEKIPYHPPQKDKVPAKMREPKPIVREIEINEAIKSSINKNPNPQSFNFNLYPNPNNGQFSVEFYVPQKQDVYLQLYDNSGKFIKEELIPGCEGNVTHLLQSSNLSTGTYYLHMIMGDKVTTKKLIIKT